MEKEKKLACKRIAIHPTLPDWMAATIQERAQECNLTESSYVEYIILKGEFGFSHEKAMNAVPKTKRKKNYANKVGICSSPSKWDEAYEEYIKAVYTYINYEPDETNPDNITMLGVKESLKVNIGKPGFTKDGVMTKEEFIRVRRQKELEQELKNIAGDEE